MMNKKPVVTALVAFLVAFLIAFAMTREQAPAVTQATDDAALQAELTMERPIDALNSIWIEELTWIEIRDRMADGTSTVIIPTGGIEQNGPYVAMGKHNYVLQGACEGIARELGNALCAPIVKLVPEGGIEEPTGHMRYPGTISLREETFQAVLDDVASSLQAHGFEHIVFIGDSGGNQDGMAVVADRLNERQGKSTAHYIPEFYDNAGVQRVMEEEFGIFEESEGFHDTYWLTAMQMTVDPSSVRYEERVAAGRASINGVSIAPLEKTIEVGTRLMQYRIDNTSRLIRAAIEGAP